MLSCTLCEKETCYISKFCTKCRRIKHLLNLYGDDVYNTLETVLVRNNHQQANKIMIAEKKIDQHLKKMEHQKLGKTSNVNGVPVAIIKPYNLRKLIKN
uniref:Uncharacterized protein n=1 Tax=viral metagenome TaxID=1070528 RepID=A0A6C0EIU2_9ZZZZ